MAAKGWEAEKIFMGVLKAVWRLVPERPTERVSGLEDRP